MDNSKNLSQVIRSRLQLSNTRFWAGDNISEFISESEKQDLIVEVADKYKIGQHGFDKWSFRKMPENKK